jgi:hypothetical protein
MLKCTIPHPHPPHTKGPETVLSAENIKVLDSLIPKYESCTANLTIGHEADIFRNTLHGRLNLESTATNMLL